MKKSMEQIAYEKYAIQRHEVLQAWLKATDQQSQVKRAYDDICAKTAAAWDAFKNSRKEV